jgi:hypothetical protein
MLGNPLDPYALCVVLAHSNGRDLKLYTQSQNIKTESRIQCQRSGYQLDTLTGPYLCTALTLINDLLSTNAPIKKIVTIK